jgi:hypothetical protein
MIAETEVIPERDLPAALRYTYTVAQLMCLVVFQYKHITVNRWSRVQKPGVWQMTMTMTQRLVLKSGGQLLSPRASSDSILTLFSSSCLTTHRSCSKESWMWRSNQSPFQRVSVSLQRPFTSCPNRSRSCEVEADEVLVEVKKTGAFTEEPYPP